MKHPCLTTAVAALAACVYAPPTVQAQGKAPRTVQVSATTAPPVIRTSLNESTLLELPAEEKVAIPTTGLSTLGTLPAVSSA
jgi:hypothetical protein